MHEAILRLPDPVAQAHVEHGQEEKSGKDPLREHPEGQDEAQQPAGGCGLESTGPEKRQEGDRNPRRQPVVQDRLAGDPEEIGHQGGDDAGPESRPRAGELHGEVVDRPEQQEGRRQIRVRGHVG